MTTSPRPFISVIVCAHDEAEYITGCIHSLLAQTRPPDEVIVVDNASTDETGARAAAVRGVRLLREPRKGLVRARECGRQAARGDLLVYVDADCRPPVWWLERLTAPFARRPDLVAVSGAIRFWDWHWHGRALVHAYDLIVAPLVQFVAKHILRAGVVFYGGNFAARRSALDRIGGFDTSIEFHGEDTNIGRRLLAAGDVQLRYGAYLYTSARRYRAMGMPAVLRLYARNFVSELLWHRPRDTAHVDVRESRRHASPHRHDEFPPPSPGHHRSVVRGGDTADSHNLWRKETS